MTNEHPNETEVLAAFGHAFKILVRYFHDRDDDFAESWAKSYRERVLHEIRCEMGVDE